MHHHNSDAMTKSRKTLYRHQKCKYYKQLNISEVAPTALELVLHTFLMVSERIELRDSQK
jgi:hypothetical protein